MKHTSDSPCASEHDRLVALEARCEQLERLVRELLARPLQVQLLPAPPTAPVPIAPILPFRYDWNHPMPLLPPPTCISSYVPLPVRYRLDLPVPVTCTQTFMLEPGPFDLTAPADYEVFTGSQE